MAEKHTVLGFACSHIFHLSCLLTYNEGDEISTDEEARFLNGEVGAKIEHAKDLRVRVGGGCPLSVHKDKA